MSQVRGDVRLDVAPIVVERRRRQIASAQGEPGFGPVGELRGLRVHEGLGLELLLVELRLALLPGLRPDGVALAVDLDPPLEAAALRARSPHLRGVREAPR